MKFSNPGREVDTMSSHSGNGSSAHLSNPAVGKSSMSLPKRMLLGKVETVEYLADTGPGMSIRAELDIGMSVYCLPS